MTAVGRALATVADDHDAGAIDSVTALVELGELQRAHRRLQVELARERRFPGLGLLTLAATVTATMMRGLAHEVEADVWDRAG